MQIYFCEHCSKRMSDVDLDRGSAVMVDNLTYCRACAGEAGILEAALAKQQEESKRRALRHTSRKRGIGPSQTGMRSSVRSAPYGIYGVVIAGVVLGIIILGVVFIDREPPTSPRAVAPPPPPPPRGAALEPVGAASAPAARNSRHTSATLAHDSAPAGKPSGEPEETVVFLCDFEWDANGWDQSLGRRVEDDSLADSKWAYESTLEGDEVYSKKIILATDLIQPERKTFFPNPPSETLLFDYYVTSDGPSPIMSVALWDTQQNWYHHEKEIVTGRWATMVLPVASAFRPTCSDEGEPVAKLVKDSEIAEIRIELRHPATDTPLKIDNLRIVEILGTGRVTSAAALQGKVVFSCNFEHGADGWDRRLGRCVADDSIPGSKWVYESMPEGDEAYSRKITLAGNLIHPEKETLFPNPPREILVFDYYVTSDASSPTMSVALWDTQENWYHHEKEVVTGRWATMILPVATSFTPSCSDPADPLVKLVKDSRITEVQIGFGLASVNPTLRIDNLRIIETTESTGEGVKKLRPRQAAPASPSLSRMAP